MSILHCFNTNIAVLIVTEWLTFQDFALLEACSDIVQSLLICLSQQYCSRFRLLLNDKDMVVPICAGSVKWLDRHSWMSDAVCEITESTLSLVKQEWSLNSALSQSMPVMSWNKSLVRSLHSMKRMMTKANLCLSEAASILIFNSLENLDEFHFKNRNYTSQCFLKYMPCISRLISLRLYEASEAVCFILRKAVSLQSFLVDMPVNTLVIPTMVVHCRSLTSIRIRHSDYVSQREPRKAFFAIAFHCCKLFTALQLPLHTTELLLRSLLIYRGGPQLKSLVCTPHRHFGHYEGYLDDIADLAPNLTSLTPCNHLITISHLNVIQSRFTQLKVLDLGKHLYPDSEVVQRVLTDCPQVTALHLNLNKKLASMITSLLENDGPVIRNRIKHLTLEGQYMSDSTLLCLPKLCPHLTSLFINDTDRVTDAGIVPLLQTGKLQWIRVWLYSLTEITLLNIAKYCYDLRELELRADRRMLDALYDVVSCCHKLKKLNCHDSPGDNFIDRVRAINPRVVISTTWYN